MSDIVISGLSYNVQVYANHIILFMQDFTELFFFMQAGFYRSMNSLSQDKVISKILHSSGSNWLS